MVKLTSDIVGQYTTRSLQHEGHSGIQTFRFLFQKFTQTTRWRPPAIPLPLFPDGYSFAIDLAHFAFTYSSSKLSYLHLQADSVWDIYHINISVFSQVLYLTCYFFCISPGSTSPARCVCQIKTTVSHPKVRVSDVHVLSPWVTFEMLW